MNQAGVVDSITTLSDRGSFMKKEARIAPRHQPFYKAVVLGGKKIFFTPAMAFYIASATLSLGENHVHKDELKSKMSEYFSGVDYLYS